MTTSLSFLTRRNASNYCNGWNQWKNCEAACLEIVGSDPISGWDHCASCFADYWRSGALSWSEFHAFNQEDPQDQDPYYWRDRLELTELFGRDKAGALQEEYHYFIQKQDPHYWKDRLELIKRFGRDKASDEETQDDAESEMLAGGAEAHQVEKEGTTRGRQWRGGWVTHC